MLYDYYANTLNPIIDRRDEGESSHLNKRSVADIEQPDRYLKRFFLERARPVASLQEQQQRIQQQQQQPRGGNKENIS